MPLFAYRARDQRGILVTGHLEGIAAEPVKAVLSEQGLIPLSIRLIQAKSSLLPEMKWFKKVKDDELVLMTRQFHTLFKAGMSMEMLLGTLSRQTRNKTFRETLQRIQTDISQGSTLAKAFAKHPKIFNDLYISMLSAGEEAGILEEVLNNLSELLQKEVEIQTGVKSATLYPKLVVGVLCIAMTIMLIWVFPEFAKFYGHYKAALPLPTRIIMGMSDVLRHYGWAVVLLLFAGYIAIRRYYQTPAGKLRLDGWRWRVPVFGTLGQKIANARFAHILSALYHSGLSVTKSLNLVENVIQNEVMAKDIRLIRADIERGQSLSEAMKKSTCFSPMLVEATAIGEKTGSLDDMLKGLGEHYDIEIHHMVKNLTTLLEPILLGFIFGFVALFALAIFLPIWNMSSAVMHG
ncbi:MAG: type II secretion system F family protein [Deltaproteobacteria bacterium]|nr:type II secretion system F family protein [Deltaproteobacteria bacterium]